MISWIPLDTETRERITAPVAAAGIPVDLWVRIAVEASRLVEEIAALCGQGAGEVSARLQDAAAVSSGPDHGQIASHALGRYAAELRLAGHKEAMPDEFALRLPEELIGAWASGAASERVGLPAWVARRLRSVPAGCVDWEIAAARDCRSLGEWAYASWLRASASSSA